jgi:hypothetical protein
MSRGNVVNLYLVSRKDDTSDAWDEYRALVVVAESEADAKTITPGSGRLEVPEYWNADNLSVQLLGSAVDHLSRGIVLTDFLHA